MLEPSKLAQITKEFCKYKLTLLGLCETRWPDCGEQPSTDGVTLLYSGKPVGQPRSSGVGLLLSKSAKEALVDWKPHTDRIISARFCTRARHLSVVQCYAPTENADESDKGAFYSQLTQVLDSIHRGDITILMGDFNAQVGNDNKNFESVMGRHGLGTMNDNGTLFAETCASNALVIGGTLFPHKRIHKATWISPDRTTENQIDHIAISKKWRGSLLDVCVKRGADASSDHHLLLGALRFKVAAIKNSSASRRRIRFETSKLKQVEIRNNYASDLATKSAQLQTSFNNLEEHWEKVKSTILETASQHIGSRKETRKSWISDDTWSLIQQRKDIKLQLNAARTRALKLELGERYSQMDKNVKRGARRDKRRWAEEIATQAETAAATNKTRELHESLRRLTGKKMKCSKGKPLTGPDGTSHTDSQAQLEIWVQHYTNLLSINQPIQDLNICSCESHRTRDDISILPPSLSEICDAISSLKNNKSAGIDDVAPEMLSADPGISASLLLPIIENFWNVGELPSDLKEGLIINVPKKGNLSDCSNYRGITLLSMVNKVIAHILNKRISIALSPELRKEQAGFRPNHSCVDHINTLRIIIEQSIEMRTPLYLTFIDFQKAFDTLSHNAIWTSLRCKGVPTKIINLIKAMYDDSYCRILHDGLTSQKIKVHTGVRQGCVLSPLLFNIVLDTIMIAATREPNGITWGFNSRLEDLDYADDICLLTHQQSTMQHKLNQVQEYAERAGLAVNSSKTKFMRINAGNTTPLILGNIPLEEVMEFNYLGSILTATGGSEIDINNRMKKARQAFGALNNVWKSSQIKRSTKIRIFNSNVKSVLLYGCETWNTSTKTLGRVQAFVNRCLRRILRIHWPSIISNQHLYERCNQIPTSNEIRSRKWRWIGHTLRKPEGNIAKEALEWNPQGSRRRGRPVQTWRRQVRDELQKAHITWSEIKLLALRRNDFKNFVVALCST